MDLPTKTVFYAYAINALLPLLLLWVDIMVSISTKKRIKTNFSLNLQRAKYGKIDSDDTFSFFVGCAIDAIGGGTVLFMLVILASLFGPIVFAFFWLSVFFTVAVRCFFRVENHE